MQEIVLSSGRVLRPNGGFVGINSEMAVCEGYDGGIDVEEDWSAYGGEKPWTAAEQVEFADIMIQRWMEWKTRAAETVSEPESDEVAR